MASETLHQPSITSSALLQQGSTPVGEDPSKSYRVISYTPNAHHFSNSHQLSNSHSHHHYPSIIPNKDGRNTFISLQVCQECQSSLLHVFDHCLHHQKDMMIPPDAGKHAQTSEKSEAETIGKEPKVELGKESDESPPPPFYRLIQDPSEDRTVLYYDLKDTIFREQYAMMQKLLEEEKVWQHDSNIKKDVEKKGGQAAIPDSEVLPPSKTDASSLYRLLQAKKKQLLHLEEMVYEKTVQGLRQQDLIGKLRHALKLSLRYYTSAEMWQHHGTLALQQDVVHLKAELSSLLAFLINSEQEKIGILADKRTIQAQALGKDALIRKLQQQQDDLRSKLNIAHKDFLSMNERMKTLEHQAEVGTEAAQHRNHLLQRNLEKVTGQFEINARETMGAQKRLRQLEFEMQELVEEYTQVEKERNQFRRQNELLSENLQKNLRLNDDLTCQVNLLGMQNTQMDEDIKELTKSKSDMKTDMEKKISDLTTQLEKTTKERDTLDKSAKKLNLDYEKVKNALKDLTKAKDKLENHSRTMEQKFMKELQKKEDHVKKLYEEITIERKNVEVLQHTREQLMFQVTDLKNHLDMESSHLNAKVEELENTQKKFIETVDGYEEKVSKLLQVKSNLTKDKHQLSNVIREVRHMLSESQRAHTEVEEKFHKHIIESDKKISELEKTIMQLETSYKVSTDAHSKLKGRYKELQVNHNNLKSEHSALQSEYDRTSMKLQVAELGLKELSGIRESLFQQNGSLKTELADFKLRLDSVVEKLHETESSKFLIVTDLQEKLSDRENDVRTLTKHIFELTDYKKRILLKCRQLILQNEQLQDELQSVRKSLYSETMSKAALELSINELKQNLTMETKTRLEYERLYSRLHRKVDGRELDKLTLLQLREKKMKQFDLLLKDEYRRVSDVVHILEKVELPQINKFSKEDTKAVSGMEDKNKKFEVNSNSGLE